LDAANIEVLEDLCNTVKFGSLCVLDFTPYLVMSGLNHFPEDFGAPPRLQAAE
jgi:formate dehydrogenase iron-sulfur subunit